jgi:hypothetical protein
MKPKPQTSLDRAAQIGVSIPTLDSWKRCGVNVFDDDEVRRRIAKMRNIPPELKPEFQPQVCAHPSPPSDDPTQIDIESIIAQMLTVTDKHQAQTVKIQIDGLVNAYKLREAAGLYVSRAKVEEDLIRIGAAVKGAILRMEADLPPMLDGASPAQMQRTIRDKTDEVLAALSDASSEIWNDETE